MMNNRKFVQYKDAPSALGLTEKQFETYILPLITPIPMFDSFVFDSREIEWSIRRLKARAMVYRNITKKEISDDANDDA